MPDLATPITTTEQLQEEINRAIAPRVQRERDKFGDYDELKQFKADAESTLSAATQKIADLESQVQQLNSSLSEKELDIEREKVAHEKRVPARYLTGSSREEMEAAADAFLEDAKQVGKKVGYVPTQGTGDPKASLSPFEAGHARGQARYQKNT